MKKYLKIFLYSFIYILLILVFAVMFIVTTQAEVIKPNNSIEPFQVVKIQLRSLKENDKPVKDNGILQTWEFAHPNNQKYTGPIEKFKSMLKSDSFSMLINHREHQVKEIYKSDDVHAFEVVILDLNKKYFKFNWKVEKYKNDGPLKDCWLTTAVSQPIDLGSSI